MKQSSLVISFLLCFQIIILSEIGGMLLLVLDAALASKGLGLIHFLERNDSKGQYEAQETSEIHGDFGEPARVAVGQPVSCAFLLQPFFSLRCLFFQYLLKLDIHYPIPKDQIRIKLM